MGFDKLTAFKKLKSSCCDNNVLVYSNSTWNKSRRSRLKLIGRMYTYYMIINPNSIICKFAGASPRNLKKAILLIFNIKSWH